MHAPLSPPLAMTMTTPLRSGPPEEQSQRKRRPSPAGSPRTKRGPVSETAPTAGDDCASEELSETHQVDDVSIRSVHCPSASSVFGPLRPRDRVSPGGSPLTRRPTLKSSKSLAQARVRVGFSNQDPTFRTSGRGHLMCNCCDADIPISLGLGDTERDQVLQSHMCTIPWLERKWKTYMCRACQQSTVDFYLDLFEPDDAEARADNGADTLLACTNCTKKSQPEISVFSHEINIASRDSRAEKRVLTLCSDCTDACSAQLASLRK